MERCPVCRARLREEVICPRCGVELELPIRVQGAAEEMQRLAFAALARGEVKDALALARRSVGLENTPLRMGLVEALSAKAVEQPGRKTAGAPEEWYTG